MTKTYIQSLFLVLFLLSNIAVAHDLLSLYQDAHMNDAKILIARESYKSAAQVIPKARVNFLPTITHTSYSSATDSSDPLFRRYNNWGTSIDIKQYLFRIRDWGEFKQASYTEQAAAAALVEAEQELLLRVATAYFSVLKAEDELKFSKAEKRAFAQQCLEAKQKLKVGLIPITDLHEAQARYDMSNATEIAAINNVSNEKEKLKVLIGYHVDDIDGLQENIVLAYPNPNNVEQWIQQAITNNWRLKSLQHNLRAVKTKIFIEQSRHLPELAISGSVGRAKQLPPQHVKASVDTIGIQFMLPIFNGGSAIINTQEARHNYAKTEFEVDATLRDLTTTTATSFRNMITRINQVNALKQAIKSSNAALQATQAAYKVGTRTIVDVLTAQSNALKAARDCSIAHYEYVVEMFTLKQKTGSLNFDDLQQVNGWLKKQ